MPKRCAICHSHAQLSEVVVAGKPTLLCGAHREAVGDAASFEDLAAALAAIDRRAEARSDRREQERRMFPRPEGRRMGGGRRDGDPDRA
jgi:hypothetical protein